MAEADNELHRGARLVTSAGPPPVLRIEGEVDLSNSAELRAALYEVIDRAIGQPVVVDLAGLEFIDSSGLGVLVAALKHARQGEGDVLIRNLGPPARRVFEITGLVDLFVTDKTGP